jgi:membrane protein implicated in regulation of membrane protease activity
MTGRWPWLPLVFGFVAASSLTAACVALTLAGVLPSPPAGYALAALLVGLAQVSLTLALVELWYYRVRRTGRSHDSNREAHATHFVLEATVRAQPEDLDRV